MAITITEALDAKEKMRVKILEAVEEFENTTGLQVTFVGVSEELSAVSYHGHRNRRMKYEDVVELRPFI